MEYGIFGNRIKPQNPEQILRDFWFYILRETKLDSSVMSKLAEEFRCVRSDRLPITKCWVVDSVRSLLKRKRHWHEHVDVDGFGSCILHNYIFALSRLLFVAQR